MRKFWSVLFLLGVLLMQSTLASSITEETQRIKTRLRVVYMQEAHSEAAAWLAKLDDAGKWSDINYGDTVRTGWTPLYHLDRLRMLAIAYQNTSDPLYQSPLALAAIERALRLWYREKPKSENWFQNYIGQQRALIPTLVLMEKSLHADILKQGINLLYDPKTVPSYAQTGQNLLWAAGEQLVRGALLENDGDLQAASAAIQGEIKLSSAEGVQADYSFHQHGAQLYSGGYGRNFSIDNPFFASVLANTRWAFTPEKLDIISNYMLQGQRSMIRKHWFDFSARGREPARLGWYDGALDLAQSSEQLAPLVPAYSAELLAMAAHIRGKGDSASYIGNRHFWRSDYMTHQRGPWYASVRMFSNRLIGTELVSSENKKGYWLPFGLTYLLHDAEEYRDIWPIWDWGRLPGVTSPHIEMPPTPAKSQTQPETFVGGVSDGQYGAAAMRFDAQSTRAQKAWFFFDNEMLALGNSIRSSHAQPIATTLNQTRLRGEVIVNGNAVAAGEHSLDQVRWVYHDGFAYILPQAAKLTLKNQEQSGSWHSINDRYPAETISMPIFSLWQDHGTAPLDASYAYIVLANATPESSAAYAAAPAVRILANNAKLQAVQHAGLGITQAVFPQSGDLQVRDGLKISVDQPCILMLRESNDSYQISAANPENKAMTLQVYINTEKESRIEFKLAGGDQAGQTLSKIVHK